jgi:release factor glutamine methyltransferase
VDAASPVPATVAAAFAAAVARRRRHEPIEYITGQVQFRGLELGVGAGVFIPRPETEGLVEHALTLGPPGAGTVLDLCTGSGAVACALAAARPAWAVRAVDCSPGAVACARANVRGLGLETRVRVLAGDLAEPRVLRDLPGPVDLVVANPPYLRTAILPTLPREVRDWEPVLALDGGEDGTAVIGRVLTAGTGLLRAGGALVVEIGEDQGARLLAGVVEHPGYRAPVIHRDFRGRERVLVARRA